MTKYEPKAVYGTSNADHLAYEIYEQLKDGGYTTQYAAQRAWRAACRKADRARKAQGYSPVSRPDCKVMAR